MPDTVTNVPWNTHSQMVEALFKVLPDAQDLLHAAVGVSGEVSELVGASSRENVIEECGDIEFYLEAAWQAMTRIWPTAGDYRCPRQLNNYSILGYNAPDLTISAGALLDVAKKRWVYNKITLPEDVAAPLASIQLDLDSFYNLHGIDRSQVLMLNMVKLAKRYGERYTDAAAQARADKETPNG